MKKIIKWFLNFIPENIKKKIDYLRFIFRNGHLKESYENYRFTDERSKFIHLLECVNYIRVSKKNKVPSVFYEFGCQSGRTFSCVINAGLYFGMKDLEYFAFDSFEGLPNVSKDDDGIFQKGTYNTSYDDFLRIIKMKTGVKLKDENVIKGFYSQTLIKELQLKLPKVGMVHIDVDLYSSAKEVLNFILPLIVSGTVIIFDDWYCFPPGSNKGEMRALNEILEENPGLKLKEWKSYSSFGKSFFVVSVPK